MLAAALGALCLLLVAAPRAPGQSRMVVYTITDLGTLGGSPTGPPIEPRAINTLREVVGSAWAAEGFWHAFLWSGGSIQDLGRVGQGGSPLLGATDINGFGHVAGNSQAADGTTHAWRLTLAREDLGTLAGGTSSWALHIDLFGDVEGVADRLETDPSGNPILVLHAVRWPRGPAPPDDLGALPPGLFTPTIAMNRAGQVVGSFPAGVDPITFTPILHAFRWQSGVIQDLGTLGGAKSSAAAINDDGDVVGWADVPGDPPGSFHPHAVLWDAFGTHDLSVLPGGRFSQALGLNNFGSIVGSDAARAVLWNNGEKDLNALIPVQSGWSLTAAVAINDNSPGDIVAVGSHNGQPRACLLTPWVGVAGKLGLSTSALAFRNQRVNTAARQTLVVGNNGTALLNVTVGALAAPFRVVSGGGRFSLRPGTSRNVVVEFRPTRRRLFSAVLAIASDDPFQRSASVAVTGTGS
jgi:probable HAF family extracellular repeat protein